MDRKERISIINALEKERNSKVIIYFTSERPPQKLFSTQIAIDVLELFYKHLQKTGKPRKISLCICSNGGNIDTPWPLVNLIREYCKEFEVLIPYKALSAATLIALGANKIVMVPISQLSPVDPQTNIKTDNAELKLSVEDVVGFIALAKEKIGITEQASLAQILTTLVGEVPPSMLGSINRIHSLIRRVSTNMLKLHLHSPNYENQIEDVVENLTQKLFSHQHFINRREAKNIIGFGEMIEFADKKTEKLLDKVLTAYYYEGLETMSQFNPNIILGEDERKEYIAKRAFIESTKICHIFLSKINISRVAQTAQVEANVTWQGWRNYNGG